MPVSDGPEVVCDGEPAAPPSTPVPDEPAAPPPTPVPGEPGEVLEEAGGGDEVAGVPAVGELGGVSEDVTGGGIDAEAAGVVAEAGAADDGGLGAVVGVVAGTDTTGVLRAELAEGDVPVILCEDGTIGMTIADEELLVLVGKLVEGLDVDEVLGTITGVSVLGITGMVDEVGLEELELVLVIGIVVLVRMVVLGIMTVVLELLVVLLGNGVVVLDLTVLLEDRLNGPGR